MDFIEVLDQVAELLRQRGRLTYRTIKLQFNLDDEYLDALKDELIEGQQVAVDENGRVLIWTGESEGTSVSSTQPAQTTEPSSSSADQKPSPISYTPQHLTEKILTSRSALEGERKQVTVMFADLVNSTAIAERIGPEAMHTLLNRFFELALDEVHRYEGTINQFLGDGFMALFGAPIAHEDHVRRAVHAAVSMRRRLHTEAIFLGQPDGVGVETRMGLHTGLVIVGAIGDNLRMDYSAIGDTTNVASRLQSAAAPGQIVISDATHRLVEGYCTAQSLGEMSLKGKAEPVQAWAVLAVQESRTRLEVEAERGLTPFVGRERECQLLMDCFTQAQAGHGQIVFLVGEAGIGKSRLLLELRHRIGTDATWLEGHAMSFGQSMAFRPLIDMLRRNFGIEEDDPEHVMIEKIDQHVLRLDATLQPILPYVRYLLAVDPGDAAIQALDPQLRRAELFDALRRLLLRAAEVRPQVVVFEDLHWTDKATEAFAAFFADSIPTSRVLCLFTHRPDYRHPFGERTYHTRVSLPTLSATDTLQMAQAMLTTEHLPDDLTALIVQKAEGNPFFVEEVVKSLRESGILRQEDDRYILSKPLEEVIVPDTIQDALMARIDCLEEAPKRTLQLASVVGREFTYRLLDRLTDIQQRTEACLQELKAIELIYEKSLFPELLYMFKHALTQDVAYNSLLEQQRKDLHGTIALAIEELYAEHLPEHYDMLAYHFVKGEKWHKALDYLFEAAQKAAQAFAPREALCLYDQVLEVLDQLEPAAHVETLMATYKARAGLRFALGNFDGAEREWLHLAEVARQANDHASEGAALAGASSATMWAEDFDQALAYASQAIEIGEQTTALAALGGGIGTTAYIYAVTSRLNEARSLIDRTLPLSRSAGEAAQQALALFWSGFMNNWQGEYVTGTSLLGEGVELARRHNLLAYLIRCLWAQGVTLVGRGSYDQAQRVLNEAFELADKIGDETMAPRILNTLGWLFIECQDFERGIAYNARGADRARLRHHAVSVEMAMFADINLADAYLARQDLATAGNIFNTVYGVVTHPETHPWMKWRYATHMFVGLGEYWLTRGNPAKAELFIDQGLDIARRTNSRKYLVNGWRLKGDIALARREWEQAEEWLNQALSMAQTIGNPTQLWKTHVALGRLLTALKRPEQARQAYTAACNVIERVKASVQTSELRAGFESILLLPPFDELSR